MSRAAVVIKINGDAADFSNELKKVEKETKTLSSSLGSIAAASSVGFGVLTAAIGASVLAYRDQVKVEKQTEAVLRSTGGAAGVTAEQVYALASALQKVTNFGDETIVAAEDMLLTFTNIKKDVFPQVTALALDMATAMGTDATSAAQSLGKALNSPIQGMNLLRRSGVVFTEEQKKTIETLVQTGQVAEAQAILIEKLSAKYGGSAKAAADPFIQLKEVMGDVVQAIGSVFNPLAEKMAIALKNVAFWLIEANPQFLRIAAYILAGTTAILGLTAAVTIGMLIFLKATAVWAAYSASAGIAALATGALTTALGAMGSVIAFATGPIGILIIALAAIGVAVYKNWDAFKAFFTGVGAGFRAFAEEIGSIIGPLATLISGLILQDWSRIKEGFTSLQAAFAEGGASAADAFSTSYNESMEASKADRLAAAALEVPPPDYAAHNEALSVQSEYEVEVNQEKKDKVKDAEQRHQEELTKIKDESQLLDLNRDAAIATEKARIDLDEKKRKLSDEAKYGKAVADVKAFYRKEEIQQTSDAFQTLSTLTQSKNKELFQIGKVAALAHATINIAEGISKAIAQGGFFGLFMGAAVAAAGAVQIAAISGTNLQAAKGYSGGGSAFGESFVSTFTPREIVVPERFSEGIKKGEFSLTSAGEQSAGGGAMVEVHISLNEDAAEILEAKQIERTRLNIGKA